MKIEITKDCIGCGACVALCGKYFEMNSVAKPKKNPVEKEDETSVKSAKEACPVDAIKLG